MAGEKTEQPTPQKLKKAKQEGQIGRSQDVGAWFGMLAASIMLPRTLSSAMDHARELMAKLPDVIADPDPAVALGILKDGMMSAAWAVLPLALTMMAVGIAATLQCLVFAINPMGALERGDDLATQIGVYVGLLGAVIWAIGSGLLAKEIEGDDDDHTDAYTRGSSRDR